MNKKKFIKYWIEDKVDFIYYKYNKLCHYAFSFTVDREIGYLLNDKAIEKRIIKLLNKKYNFKATCYKYYFDDYTYCFNVYIVN